VNGNVNSEYQDTISGRGMSSAPLQRIRLQRIQQSDDGSAEDEAEGRLSLTGISASSSIQHFGPAGWVTGRVSNNNKWSK